MSVPVKYCFLVKAADSEDDFRRMLPVMKRNLDCGHFTVYPCDCEPHCRQLTDEESADLMTRFKNEPLGDAGA